MKWHPALEFDLNKLRELDPRAVAAYVYMYFYDPRVC